MDSAKPMDIFNQSNGFDIAFGLSKNPSELSQYGQFIVEYVQVNNKTKQKQNIQV